MILKLNKEQVNTKLKLHIPLAWYTIPPPLYYTTTLFLSVRVLSHLSLHDYVSLQLMWVVLPESNKLLLRYRFNTPPSHSLQFRILRSFYSMPSSLQTYHVVSCLCVLLLIRGILPKKNLGMDKYIGHLYVYSVTACSHSGFCFRCLNSGARSCLCVPTGLLVPSLWHANWPVALHDSTSLRIRLSDVPTKLNMRSFFIGS